MKKIAFLMLTASFITACSSEDISSSVEDVIATNQTENLSVSGFLPSEFDIKKLDVFGAAYFDNKWLGVRFYKY